MFKSASASAKLGGQPSFTAATMGPLASGWLRTKGRDAGALASAVAGNRLQQLKAWNLWWVTLSRGNPGERLVFTLRCYADETLTQLKEELPLQGGHVSVEVLDTEAAVLSAGLKAKHVGKQLVRVTSDDLSIVLEASDPDALAAWVAPLSAAALELDAAAKEEKPPLGSSGARTSSASTPALDAFRSRTAPPAFGLYPPPPGGWPSGGQLPAWQSLAFMDLFADVGMAPPLAHAAAMEVPLEQRLRSAFELVAGALGKLPGARPAEARAAAQAAGALLGGLEVLRQLPIALGDASRFMLFLAWFVDRVSHMRPGHAIAFPGGWLTPEGDGHLLVHVLTCEASGTTFSFATVNTGAGLEYHPWVPDGESLTPKRALTVTQTGVEAARLTDSAFWTFLFRPLCFPSREHGGAAALYGTLLPYLTGAPLLLKACAAFSDAEVPPQAGDASRGAAALEAARFLVRCAGGLPAQAARRVALRLRWSLLAAAAADLRAEMDALDAYESVVFV